MYPAILSTNKKIHEEAIGVLYGENCFEFTVDGFKGAGLWHFLYGPLFQKRGRQVPRKYTRLITKVFLTVEPRMWAIDDSLYPLTKSLDVVAEKLIINNLKLLKVTFRGFLGIEEEGGRTHDPKCLVPLLKIRATRVSTIVQGSSIRKRLMTIQQLEIEGCDNDLVLVAKLKATIEGPMDEAFLEARRLAYQGDKE